MDLMSLTARELSNRCLEAFQICLTFRSPDPGLSNQHASHDERFEYRLADFNLWIDGIGALAPSKASLDARLSERPIDLSLVKGNLVMLFQSLEDCLDQLKDSGSLEDALLDIDSALESLVTLSLAIRRTGRRSRLQKADRLFIPEEHAELRKHLEAIIQLRPGPGPCCPEDESRTKMASLTPLQCHLVTANLKRRNRFIQAQLHSLGLKKRSVGFEITVPETEEQHTAPAPRSENRMGGIDMPTPASTPQPTNRPLPAPMSVTSASVPDKSIWQKIYVHIPAFSIGVLLQMFIIVVGRCWNSTFDKTIRQFGYVRYVGEDISSIISSASQIRMGIDSCPLCEVKGDTDSPELIDHVLEHVHDFSLRSLPWPRPSEVDIGGEVGSFNHDNAEGAAITLWLDGYEHETEDIDPTLQLSTCDYERLAIITEQIRSEGEDKLGLDYGFADEHGDESAEAETDISHLTQHTTESANESLEEDTLYRCLDCSTITEWVLGDPITQCLKCQSKRIEPIKPENDPNHKAHYAAVLDSLEPRHSIPTARESTSGFRRLTDRLFSRKKPDDIGPQQHSSEASDNLVQFLGLKQKAVENQKAWKILINIYHRRLDSPTKTESMFANFIRDVQNEDSLPTLQPVTDPRSFLQVMVQFYLDPLKHLPPKDLTKPLSNYFINTSHRTLLHTLSEPRDAYKAIEEALYFGYRSIDLDVWNDERDQDHEANPSGEARPRQGTKAISRFLGLTKETGLIIPGSSKPLASQPDRMSHPSEPIVTDGYASMTQCGFREACQVIRKSAFVSTDLPLIVNLEVHAESDQQELMVKIMKDEWRDILIDKPLEGCDPRFRLPTLEDLRGRILIRLGTITSLSVPNSGEPDNDLPGERLHRQGRVPIIQSLAELGVYLRREKFEGFTDMRTRSPTHIFSMQESKVQELIATSATNLFRHNLDYFFRVYPSSARRGTSNLDPSRFWRYGIQMAGIVRHTADEGMMLNEGMFADESGWVLKPDGYRSSNKGTSNDLGAGPKKSLDLTIFAFKGQEFVTSTGREIKSLSSCMRLSLQINDEEQARMPRQHPEATEVESGALGYNVYFFVTRAEATIVPKLCILRLTFTDHSNEGLFAWASLRLDRLNQGFRLVQLYDSKGYFSACYTCSLLYGIPNLLGNSSKRIRVNLPNLVWKNKTLKWCARILNQGLNPTIRN
ncbi:1-phosphatidylinositol-4 5-bisphosphate phosphodiesterase [Fusarium phyllophilum]|uniref:Phosphoinositide phospholipase C n=1 Tax=Fusarium phyllophilum TaxID=47803 RepID=A0A8H5KE40_9HYPO|nr:1-phosphatidylinositol-4 5-bisphosphate phosphodiesterase [Fusarium phyllophilum]